MKLIESIQRNVSNAALRFPVAALLCIVLFTLSVCEIRDSALYHTLICGMFFAISISLFTESRYLPKWSAGIASLLVTGLLYFLFKQQADNELSRIFMLLASFFSMLPAPYLRKESLPEHMESFRSSVLSITAITFCIALAIFLAGSAILISLDYLFNIKIPRDIYGKVFLFCATLFSPLFAMGALPKDFEHVDYAASTKEHIVYGRVFAIFMPIYTVILWLYAIKIGAMWELPKGGVAYMVATFAGLAVLLYIVSFNALAQRYKLLLLWRRYFAWVLSAPTALLAVGIWARIDEYGFTEERYAIALLAFWLIGLIVVCFAKRADIPPSLIIASGVLLLILSSFGPWGMDTVSTRSQVHQLEQALIEYDLMHDGRIAPATPDSPITMENRGRVISIIRYLHSKKELHQISPWFDNSGVAEINKNKYSPQTVIAALGLKNNMTYSSTGKRVFHFIGTRLNSPDGLDISGYDYLTQIKFTATSNMAFRSQKLYAEAEAVFNQEKKQVSIMEDGEQVLLFSLESLLPLLTSDNPSILQEKKFYIESEHEQGRIYIQNVSGNLIKDGDTVIRSISILLLHNQG